MSKLSFREAMMEAGAEDLGAVGGIKDLKDENKILKGNLADAEDQIKKLRRMMRTIQERLYEAQCQTELWKRTAEAYGYEPDAKVDAEIVDIDCADELSDAGDAM